MRRSLAVAGDVDPDVAWQRYAVPAQWRTWAPFIVDVEASGPALEVGLTGIVHGPVGVRAVFAVDTVDEVNRAWSWTVRSGPAVLRLGHELLARPDGGTEATLELAGAAPVVLGYLAPATFALRKLVAR